VGISSIARPSSDDHFHLLATLSSATLESICGQAILSAFVSGIAKTALGEIGGGGSCTRQDMGRASEGFMWIEK